MRKIYTSLLVLAMLVVGTVAKAQLTVNVTSDPENDYFSGSVAFTPAQIAEALGTDEATVQSVIAADGNVYLKTADGRTNAYTGNPNEFWMNDQGVAQGYGDDGTCWFVGLRYDEAGTDENTGESYDAEVVVYMGQMPNYFKKIYTDSDLTTTLYLVNGDKEVEFDVTLHVNAAPETTLSEPTTVLSELDIVKDYTLTLDFIKGSQYEGKTYSATLEGIYDALGVTAAELDASVADYTYTQIVHIDSVLLGDGVEKQAVYSLEDQLKHPEDAAGGAWFGRYSNYDELTDKDEFLTINLPKNWGTGANTFYTQDIKLAEGEFSIVSGQFPGILNTGDTDYTYLYIIVGDKAARVKVQVSVENPPSIDFSEMTMAGEETLVVEIDADETGATPIEIDLEKIAGILGVDAADLNAGGMNCLSDPETLVNGSTAHTANNNGFWFNADGYVAAYADGAMYIEPASSTSLTTLNVGKYTKTAIAAGSSLTVGVYFLGTTQYYRVNVELKIKEEKVPDNVVDVSELKVVETLSYVAQLIQSENYTQEEKTQVDWTRVLKALETEEVGKKDIYTWSKVEDSWVPESLTNDYSCDPNPGFWMSEDGKTRSTWSPVCAYGVAVNVSSGEISWFAHDGSSHAAGESYPCELFVVNWENGNVVKINIAVNYVNERTETETVGEEEVIFLLQGDLNDNDMYELDYSLAKAIEALGMQEDEYDSAEWYVLSASGAFIRPQLIFNSEFGTAFDKTGASIDDEDPDATFIVGYDDYKGINGQFVANTYDEVTDETVYTTKVALVYDGKQYIFNIVIGGSQNAVGINSINGNNVKTGKIYDLSGRQVQNPAKGLYIMNGKTVLVK